MPDIVDQRGDHRGIITAGRERSFFTMGRFASACRKLLALVLALFVLLSVPPWRLSCQGRSNLSLAACRLLAGRLSTSIDFDGVTLLFGEVPEQSKDDKNVTLSMKAEGPQKQ